MNLLITTQIVDENSRFQFFLRWIEAFAKEYDQVHVICLEKGTYKHPKNVYIHSLGKEKKTSKGKQVIRFQKYISILKYDRVFVHMNPIWIVLGATTFFLRGKKSYLWYTHRSKTKKLWLASKIVRKIFTASEDSLQLNTKKKTIVGHGIPNIFKKTTQKKNGTVLYVGRITPIKHIETIIKGAELSKHAKKLKLIGTNIDQGSYNKKIQQLIQKSTLQIEQITHVSQEELVKEYNQATLSVNACPTGGMDKTVLESLCCETTTLIANKTFKKIFKEEFSTYAFDENKPQELASKIDLHWNSKPPEKVITEAKNNTVNKLIKHLIKEME